MEAFANVVAGLGLFFVGVWILSDNLKKLTGRSFRVSVVKWTKNPAAGLSIGTLLGAVAQSMAVTIFILVSLLLAGLITVRTAMPVMVGANVGSSVLVFLTAFNVKLVMLFVIGISGILMVSDRFQRSKAYIGALFGVGLLFLGISMLQGGAITLVEQPWASKLLESFQHSYFLTFLVGCGLTFIAQSASATSILVIALASVGVFQFDQTIMAIYGANLGSGFVSLLLSSGLKGKSRQLAMFQIIFINVIGTLLFVAAFYIEKIGGVPLIGAAVKSTSSNIEQQMAWAYLFLNLPGVLMLPFSGLISRFLEGLFPTTQFENDSKAQYIHDQAISDPSTALDLVRLEQNRLTGFYTRYFEALRKTRIAGESAAELNDLHTSFNMVSEQISDLLEDLGGVAGTEEIHERLNITMNNNRSILMIESTLFELATTLDGVDGGSAMTKLKDTVTEALDTVLLTLNDVISEGDEYDINLLKRMTGDRSDVLQNVRKATLQSHAELTSDDQVTLLKVTNLCERFFWLLRELKFDAVDTDGVADLSAETA